MREAAAEAGIDWMDSTASALFADLDNDGDADLVVGSSPQIVMENVGGGKFEGRTMLPGPGFATSITAADPDLDGDLDLYICQYSAEGPVPYHDANNGPGNLFWRNVGEWRFEDATEAAGLDQNNQRFSFSSSWEDYDNDGDLDLYVANDYGRNCLYRNAGDGHFEDVAAAAGVGRLVGRNVGDLCRCGPRRLDGLVCQQYVFPPPVTASLTSETSIPRPIRKSAA